VSVKLWFMWLSAVVKYNSV